MSVDGLGWLIHVGSWLKVMMAKNGSIISLNQI
jgi:hypothetical protein